MIWQILVFAAFLACNASASSYLRDGNSFQFASPRFTFSKTVVNLTASIETFPHNWCEKNCQGPPPGYHFSGGNVALLQSSFGSLCFYCGYARLALWAQEVNAVALLRISSGLPGHESTVVHSFADFNRAKQLGVVALEVQRDVVEQLLSIPDVEVVLNDTENPWDEFYATSWIAVQLVNAFSNLCVTVFAVVRWTAFSMYSDRFKKFRTALLVICIEGFASWLRAIYAAIDPLWSRMILSFQGGRILLSLSVPVTWIGSVLLFLAWSDLSNASLGLKRTKTSFLTTRSRVFLLLFTVMLFSIDIIFSTMASLGISNEVQVATLLIGIVNVIVAFIFIVQGLKVRNLLKVVQNNKTQFSNHSEPGEQRRRGFASCIIKPTDEANLMTRRLFITAALMILSTTAILLSGLDSFSMHPARRAFIFSTLFLSLAGLSFVKILAFRLPKQPFQKPPSTSFSSAA